MYRNIKLVHAAASFTCTGTCVFSSGLGEPVGVLMVVVIGSSFERSGPSAGVAAGLGVHTHRWVVVVGPVVRG